MSKNLHSERGTTYASHRHRPGHEPAVAEWKTPERAVEASQRAAAGTTLPPEFYGARGDFKSTPPHDAEGRIGADGHDTPTAKR